MMYSIDVVFQHLSEICYLFDVEFFWHSILLWGFLKSVLILAYNFFPLFATFLWMGYLLSATSLIQRKLIYKIFMLLQKIKLMIFWGMREEIRQEV